MARISCFWRVDIHIVDVSASTGVHAVVGGADDDASRSSAVVLQHDVIVGSTTDSRHPMKIDAVVRMSHVTAIRPEKDTFSNNFLYHIRRSSCAILISAQLLYI